jgi:hypothetical protein
LAAAYNSRGPVRRLASYDATGPSPITIRNDNPATAGVDPVMIGRPNGSNAGTRRRQFRPAHPARHLLSPAEQACTVLGSIPAPDVNSFTRLLYQAVRTSNGVVPAYLIPLGTCGVRA